VFGDYRFAKAHQEQLLREAEQERLSREAEQAQPARLIRELRRTRTALAASALILAGVCIAALVAAGV
jgi:hypothetical protein